ncbi:MAG: hypothetical protein HYS70_00340 [Nitrospinae bacterium]|nr:hypothetical protein [Nitrospinota bacterium]
MKTRMETCPLDHEGKCDENCPFQIRQRILQARANRQTAGQELRAEAWRWRRSGVASGSRQ